ncbi:MAG: membrane dipeptidase [Clostridia bacterium]|nr:membrane dipeptidase [Clostridia bacterium]
MKIFDLHNDFLTSEKNYKKAYKKFSKNVVLPAVVYSGNLNFNEAFLLAKSYLNFNKNGVVAFENIGYFDLDLSKLLSLKPLYCSLTYNDENKFGYGVNLNFPIKDEGVKVGKILNENGVFVDVAHLSKRGILSLVDNGVKVIDTHTAFTSIYNHKRNIDSQTISAIIDSGGVVGFTLVSYFLGESPTVETAVKHIDYFVQKFGYKRLCLGTDFYGSDSFCKGIANYKSLIKLAKKLDSYGYNKYVIESIFYKNAMEFFGKNFN